MSGGYFYKGINLNQIYRSGNIGATGYSGMPFSNGATTFAALQPNDFGYSLNGTPLSNTVQANTTGVLTSSPINPVSIPTGCKSINVIAVGGAGGAGGRGGNTSANSYNSGGSSDGTGGAGGTGGFGTYYYQNSILLGNEQTITVTVGAVGVNGTPGNAASAKSNMNSNFSYNNAKATGNDGTKGGDGSASIIIIGNKQITAAAGNGGTGGDGSTSNGSQNTQSSTPGTPGTSGNSQNSTYGGAPNAYPPLINGNTIYGNPSTGGAVQIIWLFD
jgi:hypothetical protein